MKRRDFLRVSARAAGAAGGLALVYPLARHASEDFVDEPTIQEVAIDEVPDFQVDVRIMDSHGPLTHWFPINNNTPEIVIEKMRACTLTHLECRVNLGSIIYDEDWWHTIKLPIVGGSKRVYAGERVTVIFNQTGMLELTM